MKRVLYRIFLGANILFVLAIIISYLSVVINPDRFALPALFGLAYPYLLLINILFALAWAALLKFEALISIIVVIAGYTNFSNYIKFTRPPGDKTGTFSVMSYNVRLFNYFERNKNTISEKRILDFIRIRQPDIVCLQELYLVGDPAVKEKEINSAIGRQYQSHLKIIPAGRNRSYGIVTISKYPIVRRGDIVHPGSSSLSIWTDVVIRNDTVRIFNNHLQSFGLQRMEKSFIDELASTSPENETFREIRSISSSLKQGFIRRAAQATSVKSAVSKSPYTVLVAGDFNDTPVSYSYRKIRKGLFDSFVTSGYGAGFTYRGNYPPNRIDYILFDNRLTCRQFNIVKARYSDHYPIVAYFVKKN